MVCLDYEEVQCSVCKHKTVDGHSETADGKISCDECGAGQKRKADGGNSMAPGVSRADEKMPP